MKRYLYLSALCASLFFPVTAQACLHWAEGGISEEPPPVASGEGGDEGSYPSAISVIDSLQAHDDKATWQARADEQRRAVDAKVWDFASQNNLSVALAHSGHLDEALDRMQTVERVFPGHYFTAYNLGTVYELRGDLPHALEWTQKGIERERTITGRNSPLDGTEWLHLRILESEVALQKNARWLDTHSVSGLDFGSSSTVETPTLFPEGVGLQRLSLTAVQNSIFEQLHERLEFVPAPNPVVGALLADLGSITALQSQGEESRHLKNDQADAAGLYKMALTFGAPHANLIQHRFDFYAGTPPYGVYLLILTFGASTVLWHLYQRHQQQQRELAAMPIMQLDEIAPPRKPVCIEWSDSYNPYAPKDPKQH